jgi:outer membrane protein OmpA-like peptidoglycan-associated protein/uncharacterized protein YegL
MLRKILLLFSLALTLQSFGQNKFIRQIEAGKYSKVWKKADKVLKKDPLNIEFNYYKAVIASEPKSGRLFDANYAFNTLINVANEYAKISDYQIILKLSKVPVNLEQLDKQLQIIVEVKLSYLKKARDLNACNEFLANYRNDRLPFNSSSLEHARSNIAFYRDTLAFEKAMIANSIDALNEFIETYPNALQVEHAMRQIHILAFNAAQKSKSIEAYEQFIQSYPTSIQRESAQDSIYHIAFRNAKIVNNFQTWNQYVKSYPSSPFITTAVSKRDFIQFNDATITKTWESYRLFIENYASNQFVDLAKDSLLQLASASSDFRLLDYYLVSIDNRDLELRNKHYTAYTADGETSTLLRYYAAYSNFLVDSIYQADLYWSSFADGLNFNLAFKKEDEPAYKSYILNNQSKDRSVVALQRLLYEDLCAGRFQKASNWIHKNIPNPNSQITSFLELIEAPTDASIKPKSIGTIVNSGGNEYAPIPTADEKSLYLCATNRADSKGGEDIFLTKKIGSNWQTPQIVHDLSGAKTNEAPLSISSDGTTFIFFRDGNLYSSQKTQLAWSEPIPLPSVFNQGEWQGDAMISADGEAILFTAVLPGNTYNRNSLKDRIYHGDKNYPTDIYVSVRDSSGGWSPVKSLGPSINTGYCERYPFLHPDMKTLYFSSDGHPGLGQMDVFVSTRMSDTCWDCWSEPINLGKEINTPNNDAGYKITTSGEQAYFTKANGNTVETSVLFVLDISGSMSGQKIEELKKASITAIEEVLSNGAEIAIAAFNGTCENPVTGWQPFTKDYMTAYNFIQSIYAAGGTPMYTAYEYACSTLMKTSQPKTEKVLVLMTDGDANRCKDLTSILNGLKQKKTLYKTQTIAYAVDSSSYAYQDLQQIAQMSGGNFFYASGTSDLGAAFERANSTLFNIVSDGDNRDIYVVNLPPHLRPDFVAKISGSLKDRNDQPIDAKINWEDLEKGQVIGSARTDPATGDFFITLPMGKNYGYYLENDAFFPISQNLDLRDVDSAITIETELRAINLDTMIVQRISVPLNNLFFDFGESQLLPSSRQELKRVAKVLMNLGLQVEISGHTDNKGTNNVNQKLSEDRAKNVMNYLVSLGCDRESFTIIGYGSSIPVADNTTDEGRAKNRRVELRFLP